VKCGIYPLNSAKKEQKQMAKTRSKRKRKKYMNAKQEKNTPTQEKEEEQQPQSELSQPGQAQPEKADHPVGKSVHLQGEEVRNILSKMSHESNTSTGLVNCYDKLEVRASSIEGNGIFATADIPSGTILEEIPFILWPRFTQLGERLYRTLKEGEDWTCEREKNNEEIRKMFGFKTPEKYYFKWFPPNQSGVQYSVIPLGFGPIYNSSNSKNNAGWNVLEKTFTFVATKDIKKGEEVCTFYGYFLCEKGDTFNVSDVFGFGLDLDRGGDNKVYLQCLRFSNNQEMQTCGKDAGFQKLNQAIGESKQRLRVRKISVIENNEEKHEFMFPDEWSLHNHFRKLKEFRYSRFKNIKFVLTHETEEQKKKNKKAPPEKKEETGTEIVITNFVNG
jgi:hypothetical protein